MLKDTLVIDLQYFGTINWINTLFQFSNIIFEQYDSWQKMSFRNRTLIAGSHGVINLSVPLENGRNQRILFKEVTISHTQNWEQIHWRTIVSCYNRSPFFEYYREDLEKLIFTKRKFLLDLNLETFSWLIGALHTPIPTSLTSSYLVSYPQNTLDLRGYFLPKNEASLLSGFTYQQVFQDRNGFIPNLSILDLLFCCGPNAKTLLKDCKLVF